MLATMFSESSRSRREHSLRGFRCFQQRLVQNLRAKKIGDDQSYISLTAGPLANTKLHLP